MQVIGAIRAVIHTIKSIQLQACRLDGIALDSCRVEPNQGAHRPAAISGAAADAQFGFSPILSIRIRTPNIGIRH
jgi:hypothetical protein